MPSTAAQDVAAIVSAAGLHVIDATHPAPGFVRLTVEPGQARAAVAALIQSAEWEATRQGDAHVLAVRPEPIDEPDADELARRAFVTASACAACNAERGEECRPGCTAEAEALDELAEYGRHQTRAAANANAYRDAVARLADTDPATMPRARVSALLAAQATRERAAARPVHLADRRDGLAVVLVDTALVPVPAPMPRTVADAAAIVAGRLADIRAELADIADAIGPDTVAGHRVTRAFHALTDAAGQIGTQH